MEQKKTRFQRQIEWEEDIFKYEKNLDLYYAYYLDYNKKKKFVIDDLIEEIAESNSTQN